MTLHESSAQPSRPRIRRRASSWSRSATTLPPHCWPLKGVVTRPMRKKTSSKKQFDWMVSMVDVLPGYLPSVGRLRVGTSVCRWELGLWLAEWSVVLPGLSCHTVIQIGDSARTTPHHNNMENNSVRCSPRTASAMLCGGSSCINHRFGRLILPNKTIEHTDVPIQSVFCLVLTSSRRYRVQERVNQEKRR